MGFLASQRVDGKMILAEAVKSERLLPAAGKERPQGEREGMVVGILPVFIQICGRIRGGIYDIVAVDHMNYKKKCIKFKCRKARR